MMCECCEWFDGEKCDGGDCNNDNDYWRRMNGMSLVERYEKRIAELEKKRMRTDLPKDEYERIERQLEQAQVMLIALKRDVN